VGRISGLGLEWRPREINEEVLVSAEIGEMAQRFTLPRGRWENEVSLDHSMDGTAALVPYPRDRPEVEAVLEALDRVL
jgi:hypothetical protein